MAPDPISQTVTHVDHVAVDGSSTFTHALTTDHLRSICSAHDIPEDAQVTNITVSTHPLKTHDNPLYAKTYALTVEPGSGCTSFAAVGASRATAATMDGGVVPAHLFLGDASTSASFNVTPKEPIPRVLDSATSEQYDDAHYYEITGDESVKENLCKKHRLTRDDMVALNHHRRATRYPRTSAFFAENAGRKISERERKQLLAHDCITEKSDGTRAENVLVPIPHNDELGGTRPRKDRSYISDRMTRGLTTEEIVKAYPVVEPRNNPDKCAQITRAKFESMLNNAETAFRDIPPEFHGKPVSHNVLTVSGSAMNGLQHNIDMHNSKPVSTIEDSPNILLTTADTSDYAIDRWVSSAIKVHGKAPEIVNLDGDGMINGKQTMGEFVDDMALHTSLVKLRRNDPNIGSTIARLKRTASNMAELGDTAGMKASLADMKCALESASTSSVIPKETYAIVYDITYVPSASKGSSIKTMDTSAKLPTTDELLGESIVDDDADAIVPARTATCLTDAYPEFTDEDKELEGDEWTE